MRGAHTVPVRDQRTVNSGDVPRCAWCGAVARLWGSRLAECDACGAATTWPPPDEEELQAAYAGFYRPASGRFSGGGDRIFHYSRGMLAGRLDRLTPPGPILDVGSGEGALLEALIARGRPAVGLEQGHQAARSRLDVRATEIVDFEDRPGEWSAVVFWHTLEHLRNPRGAIRQASRLLAPAGLLVVTVPNRDSWQARALKERWFALDLPRHLVHLPARSLVAGVRDCGLTVERVSYWRGGQVMFGWLEGLVSTLPTHPSLYDAIRQSHARAETMSPRRRIATLAAGTVLAPVATILAAAEVAARSGGSIYIEARNRTPSREHAAIVSRASSRDSITPGIEGRMG